MTPARSLPCCVNNDLAHFFSYRVSGAANDNLFKFALTVLVTYQLQVAWLPAPVAGLVIGALFIMPFVLLSRPRPGNWPIAWTKRC